MQHLNSSHKNSFWQRFISLLCIGFISSPASANLINTDFASGFANWQAEVIAYDFGTDTNHTSTGDIFTSYTDNFQLAANQVTLNTSTDQDIEYWSVTMFQIFTIAALNPGQSVWLSLDVNAMLSDAINDFFFVQLRDMDTNNILDLSAGSVFDISAWSMLNLALEFGVQDGDFVLEDSLNISNIQLNTVDVLVSAPPTLSFLFLSSLFIAIKTRRS